MTDCWRCSKKIRFYHKSWWIRPLGNPNMDAFFHPKCMGSEIIETSLEDGL